MHRWLTWLALAIWLVFSPGMAARAAQADLRLASLQVQLWPEHDQPSMLVIYDFEVPADTTLPVSVRFEIPRNANLIAVASLQNGDLMNAGFDEPVTQNDVKVFNIQVDARTTYHFEYYQPLSRNGDTRQFDYAWTGDYAVDEFTIRVQQPLDTTSLTTDPPLKPAQDSLDGLTYYISQPMALAAGAPYSLHLEYQKTSNALTVPSSNVQSSEPLDQNIPGRISAGDYWPYGIGIVAVLLIAGGAGYYYMTGRIQRFDPKRKPRVRSRGRRESGASKTEAYCHQCGQRARAGDRFCRVCGTRLRVEE